VLLRAIHRSLHVQELVPIRAKRFFQPDGHIRRQRRIAVEEIGESGSPDAQSIRGLFDRHPRREDALPNVFPDWNFLVKMLRHSASVLRDATQYKQQNTDWALSPSSDDAQQFPSGFALTRATLACRAGVW
jgi:hypothetical protein